jgi:hypothetical protein
VPVQLAQIFLLIYLTIQQNGNPLLWLIIPALAVLSFLVWWFDERVFFTAEIEYSIDKTNSWTQLKADVAEIKEKLNELGEKQK